MHKIKCCLPSTESVGVLSLEGLLFCALCCDSWHYWWRHVAIHSNRYSAGTPLCELKSSTCFTCKVNSTNETNSTRTRGSSDPPGRLSGAKETRERFETESPRSNCLDIRTGTWRARSVLCSFNSFLGGVLSLVCVLARTSQFCDPRRETIFYWQVGSDILERLRACTQQYSSVLILLEFGLRYIVLSTTFLQILEFIRDGKTVAELMSLGRELLGKHENCFAVMIMWITCQRPEDLTFGPWTSDTWTYLRLSLQFAVVWYELWPLSAVYSESW